MRWLGENERGINPDSSDCWIRRALRRSTLLSTQRGHPQDLDEMWLRERS